MRITLLCTVLCLTACFTASAQDHWEPVGSSLEQGISALAINGQGDILAAVNFKGIHLSSDSGQGWQIKNDGLISRELPVASLYFASDDRIVLGSGPFGFAGTASIYYTSDKADTWNFSRGFPPTSSVAAIIPSGGQDILCVVGDSVLRSTDKGISWFGSRIEQESQTPQLNSLVINEQGDILAAGTNGIYRRPEGGNQWIELAGPWQDHEYFTTMEIDKDNRIYAGNTSSRLYRSSNGGHSWQRMQSFPGSRRVTCMFIAPNGYVFVATADEHIYRSRTLGEDWELYSDGMHETSRVMAMALHPDGRVYAATDNRDTPLYRSTALVTGVDDNKGPAGNAARVKPNPFRESVKIGVRGLGAGLLTLRVFDLKGNEVLLRVVRAESGLHSVELDTSVLAPGTYLYHISDASRSLSGTMQKLR